MEETQRGPNQNPITSDPSVTTFPAPQPPAPSKTSSLVIVMVLLLGIASYFGYQNYQLKQQLSGQQPTPTSVEWSTTNPNISNSC